MAHVSSKKQPKRNKRQVPQRGNRSMQRSGPTTFYFFSTCPLHKWPNCVCVSERDVHSLKVHLVSAAKWDWPSPGVKDLVSSG